MKGDELQKIVAEIIDTPKPVLEKMREAVRLKPADAMKGGRKK